MSFISGAYVATYGGLSLGLLEDGVDIEWSKLGEPIKSDVGGDMQLDGIYRGMECMLNFVLSEYDAAAAQACFWPVDPVFGDIGQVGRLDSSMVQPVVLTKCAGTNAVPSVFTFPAVLLENGHRVQAGLKNRHRKLPIQLRVYPIYIGNPPYNTCSEARLFTTTP